MDLTIVDQRRESARVNHFVSTYLKLLSRSRKRESQLQKHLTHAHQVCKENDENLICEINGKN